MKYIVCDSLNLSHLFRKILAARWFQWLKQTPPTLSRSSLKMRIAKEQ